MVRRNRLRKTGQGPNKKKRLKRASDEQMRERVKGLYVDTVDVKPRNYDFGQGYAEKWEIALDLTEEEMENEYYFPMMNYIYPLPFDFENDMERKFGSNWKKEIKSKLNNTTIVYFPEEEEYAMALTGGGMNLSWEICESFVNLGYLPPVHFCDLPRMAGKKIEGKNKLIVFACMRSAEISKIWGERTKEKLEDILKSGTL